MKCKRQEAEKHRQQNTLFARVKNYDERENDMASSTRCADSECSYVGFLAGIKKGGFQLPSLKVSNQF